MKFSPSATAVLLCSIAASSIYAVDAKCGLAIGRTKNADKPNENAIMRRADLSALPPGCDSADSVDVKMSSGKSKRFVRSNRAVGHFHGESSDGSSFEYVRAKSGDVWGSIVDVGTAEVSQISVDAYGEPTVAVTASSDFADEADPEDVRRVLRGSSHSSSFVSFPDAGSVRSLSDNGDVLDVLVVWTKKAECRNSGLSSTCTLTSTTEANMRARIDLAVAETNTAYDLSGVNTQLNLVHAYLDATYVEASSDAFGTALGHLRGTTDGNMDDVHAKRTQYGADFVAMIIDDAQFCGIAYLGPRIDLMFSVTSWNCATGYYSFGHELGHNMGCNHDKGTSNACSSTNYNYGYRDPAGRFRSILAYNCRTGQCDGNAGGGCARVQRFSNDEILFNGNPIGTASVDNAQQINDVRATVAGYYQSVSGPTPTAAPTAAPTDPPTSTPTSPPTGSPTAAPIGVPTSSPTAAPTGSPTAAPIAVPTGSPTAAPTGGPTAAPIGVPTGSPTAAPTGSPTAAPIDPPTATPTSQPTGSPTAAPIDPPTASPTPSPTATPTVSPTASPVSSCSIYNKRNSCVRNGCSWRQGNCV